MGGNGDLPGVGKWGLWGRGGGVAEFEFALDGMEGATGGVVRGPRVEFGSFGAGFGPASYLAFWGVGLVSAFHPLYSAILQFLVVRG